MRDGLSAAGLIDGRAPHSVSCSTTTRGSWPMQFRRGVVEDASSDSNFLRLYRHRRGITY